MSFRGDKAQGARIALKRCAWARLVNDPMQVPGQEKKTPVYKDFHMLPLVRDCNVQDNDNTQTEYFDDMAAFSLYSKGDKAITMNRAYISNEDAVHVLNYRKDKGGKGYLEGKVMPYGALYGQRGALTPDGEECVELFVYLKVQAGGGTNNAATKQATPSIQLRTMNFTAISRLCDGEPVYTETYMADEITDEIINKFFSLETVNRLFEEIKGTVTGVDVNPDEVELSAGDDQTFTVDITGEDDPDETVEWEVIGAKSAGTTITDGVLNVAADETATVMIVTATSVQDESKSGTATVTII